MFSYLATAHRLVGDDELLVGYSVNAWNLGDLHTYATLYRPRFVRVDLDCVLGAS